MTYSLSGAMLLGTTAVSGTEASFKAINPATNASLEPAYATASKAQVEQACALAHAAFPIYRETGLEQRAAFLEACAEEIEAIGDALIERAMLETGLPRARLEGERGRTTGQLRLFAEVVREGSWLEARIDPARPERKPLPRSDLRQRHIGLGPVVVFGASNFPLAFSVAGGDTASALAAGCPVVVKAHNAHPGTSEYVGQALQRAVKRSGLPEGVFSLVFGAGNVAGTALVADPRIKAVGFTGSRGGGTALIQVAAARREPIPVYAEMSAINPVYLLPAALRRRGAELGKAFVGSLTLGAGQFCTNPGLVLAIEGPGLDAFEAAAIEAMAGAEAGVMLTPGIASAYREGVEKRAGRTRVLGRGRPSQAPNRCQAGLFGISAEAFLADESLQDEIFGAASSLIRCRDEAELRQLTLALEGQLTATLQLDEEDKALAARLIPDLELKAGRILVNGWPTGVEVGHAMVHGGPFPATSDSRTTSVGSLAIHRFLRPVCYQDLPPELLPPSIADGNPLAIWRRIDGQLGRH